MSPEARERKRARDRAYMAKYRQRPAYKARKRRWEQRNKDRVRRYQETYYARHRDELCARSRAYRQAHLEARRASDADYRKRRRGKIQAVAKVRRNAVCGRVCEACGDDDSVRSWSTRARYCGKCATRGNRNGFCEVCGEVKYQVGYRRRAKRPCSCPPELPDTLTRFQRRERRWLVGLEELLRFHEGERVKLATVGELSGMNVEAFMRRPARLAFEAFVRDQLDPSVRVEPAPELDGHPLVFQFNRRRLARALSGLVQHVALAG